MKRTALLLAFAFVLVNPILAHATLGSDAASAGADATFFGLPKPIRALGFNYILYQSTSKMTQTGPFPVQPARISEFLDPKTGRVFGVAWRLYKAPDFLQLLGVDPASVGKIGLHRAHIQTQKYIIDLGGVVGHYLGRAVRLDLLPKGVNPDIVRP